ncbi:Thioesterase [Opitutus terrae PB90-1]|uniref:Thioesterase n=2 Tax=Opitutus terrae TaxID=107709 RepID=B1ZYK6_OPITP|nr:Thioesterase [Opitutus terrae PB90-1]
MVPRPQPAARLRLVCLAHAGAGASTFFSWGAALQSAGIEVRAVQYPGRENRYGEPCLPQAPAMVQALADAWPEIAPGPCALYGHSMGALLGFELARELARRGAANPPRHLFLAGHNAPHLPSRLPLLHTLPDGEFLPAVARHYGNLPAELIADREMAALLGPILRADFQLVNEYAWRDAGPVDAPLTVFGGTEDPWTSEPGLAAWSRHTRGRCQLHLFAGGHFFPQAHRTALLARLQATLAGLAG